MVPAQQRGLTQPPGADKEKLPPAFATPGFGGQERLRGAAQALCCRAHRLGQLGSWAGPSQVLPSETQPWHGQGATSSRTAQRSQTPVPAQGGGLDAT